MKFKLALYRDQRRLAVTKLASHPDGSPWREKYEAWIRELDERIAQAGMALTELEVVASIPANSPAIQQAPSSTDEVYSAVEITGTTGIPRKQIGLSKPRAPQVVGTAWGRRNASLPHARIARAQDEGNARVQGNAQEAVYRKSLLSENELLRKMLERFA
ncbi:hypothetical protein HFO74_26310 [Rhizobium laguerreae]|uniref:Uncharacterized protein n=1 Tax=Rhizobium laguerreae TaxID=1076926 RepID=A0AB35FMK6_9HYPH|nr:hypothetical protein [Rhizobium laguerreae]MBY3066888.1 hypothetical protein [Rhizobium laguerreae]MBY3079564.1 hypothetical protein [Rhizobium laguerreae]MBY3113170.1 hypothetical protein [Rhizobium laguerreae]MBY3536811.1 hypothetical protein [Rhizobium laguerreae]